MLIIVYTLKLSITAQNTRKVIRHCFFIQQLNLKKTWLSKWFPCDDIHGVFYFCNLLPENIVLTHSKEELFNVKNKDFGEYQIRAIFVNMDNDTIVSNPITIKYIEH